MSKIETKYHMELKSWPYKEASQIIKRQGGYSNFKIPEKKESLFKKNLSSFIEGFSHSKYQRGY